MPHKQSAPFVVRWRNGVMDDPNPILTWKALVAAMALTRHANVTDGRNCYPGATRCAREMRVSTDTIQRGWAELAEAGWLTTRSRGEGRSSLKILRWPQPTADSNHPPTAAGVAADSGSTFTGTEGSLQDPPGEAPHPGKRCPKHPDVELYNGECYECEGDAYRAKFGGVA
jgi:hypothetical protein